MIFFNIYVNISIVTIQISHHSSSSVTPLYFFGITNNPSGSFNDYYYEFDYSWESYTTSSSDSFSNSPYFNYSPNDVNSVNNNDFI